MILDRSQEQVTLVIRSKNTNKNIHTCLSTHIPQIGDCISFRYGDFREVVERIFTAEPFIDDKPDALTAWTVYIYVA